MGDTLVGRLWRKVVRDKDLSVGRLVRKGLRVTLEISTAKVYLCQATQVGRGVRTFKRPRIENFGTLHIGDNTLLRSVNVPVELAVGDGATLRIGANCSLNYGTSIGATGSITLGDRVRVGPYTMIVDTDFHDPLRRNVRPPARPVSIADDVWIGAKVSIMPGVSVGRGAIVGTGAVVTRDVAAFTIVAGVPARAIKTLDASKFVQEKP